MSTPSVEPPDPASIASQLGRPSGRNSRASRARDASGRLTPEEFATRAGSADPSWSAFGVSDAETVEGAARLRGAERRADPFQDILSSGPYQAISWEDAAETITTETVGSYFHGESGRFLTEGDFYSRTGEADTERELKQAAGITVVPSLTHYPAPITYAPTSTIYPPRPRTVAAGFDGLRRVLTVVFRDGTYYNYYEVDNLQWGHFVSARSKGRHIKRYLDAHIKGPADMSTIPQAFQELLYRAARTSQIIKGGYTGRQTPTSRGEKRRKVTDPAAKATVRRARRAYKEFSIPNPYQGPKVPRGRPTPPRPPGS